MKNVLSSSKTFPARSAIHLRLVTERTPTQALTSGLPAPLGKKCRHPKIKLKLRDGPQSRRPVFHSGLFSPGVFWDLRPKAAEPPGAPEVLMWQPTAIGWGRSVHPRRLFRSHRKGTRGPPGSPGSIRKANPERQQRASMPLGSNAHLSTLPEAPAWKEI